MFDHPSGIVPELSLHNTDVPKYVPFELPIKYPDRPEPKHFIAKIVPRSSTYKNYRVVQTNSVGIVDHQYKGGNDQWFFPIVHFRKRIDPTTIIVEGERVAQFEICPSQFAPWWVKLKWIFSSKIKMIEVKSLGNKNRGGIGSTNK